MAERVNHGALDHPLDRMRALHWVLMLFDRAPIRSSSGHGLPMNRHRVVYKQFDPHSRETRSRRAAIAVSRRLVGQKELCTIYGESRYDVFVAQAPQQFRAEGRPIEVDRGVSVADGQHRRNLSLHDPLSLSPEASDPRDRPLRQGTLVLAEEQMRL
jgi:hypothetical protein